MAFYEDPREYKKINIKLPFSSHLDGKQDGTHVISHYHKMIEIIYVVEGKIVASLNGRTYEANKGDLLFINSDEVHSFFSSQTVQYAVIQFEPEMLYTTDVFDARIKSMFMRITVDASYARVFSEDKYTKKLVDNIILECEQRGAGFELAVKSDILKLFLMLYRTWESEFKKNPDYNTNIQQTVNIIDKVLDFVNCNYNTNITAKQAADHVGLSYNYFSKLFNSAMNINFSSYVNHVRISKAEHMIIATEKSITEIAMECGFCTTSYFIMKFKEKNNISPFGFRKSFKNQ